MYFPEEVKKNSGLLILEKVCYFFRTCACINRTLYLLIFGNMGGKYLGKTVVGNEEMYL